MESEQGFHDFPPAGAWDSHCHVVDEDTFPFDPQHSYRPAKATVTDLQSFHQSIGITHSCLVAVSVYGTDSRSILNALKVLGKDSSPHRAVVTIDPSSITDDELAHLHDAGVRGVRMNLQTTGDAFDRQAVRQLADRIRPLNWTLQLYIGLDKINELSELLPELRVTVVVDHLGEPDDTKGPGRSQHGYTQLLQHLKQGSLYVKLSGIYRFPKLPDLDEYVTEILREAPDRVVWASDWPHTAGPKANPGGDRTKVSAYRKFDDQAWVKQCAGWCHEAAVKDEVKAAELAQKIWVDNPRRLWQAE